ncbi:hypothetical protein COCC4DRAFT_177158 [Bipolaris maydis ATCC 48331]|uniref:Vps41 beta-propeller domain-containing protein n=2 Tax=Cochliobolus heterostrophus TaxID=5016 RepID=M2UGC6_COCH5|nr:uncharacterized protein COCC4DRAFT_177158 [Bipolaris maydis ATCC 48331]EMD97484.1 hypothetical protein COCHEDRAFT_1125063 [Bipolaris maydis C5]ENI01379.1 hypothetical protein COCC4DRAFT_177158 [Bipolaris maydis ATCC 48331]KAJ6211709.1 hypothetical protein PSV09DRAFT_1125063 [Bipolaris maydis]
MAAENIDDAPLPKARDDSRLQKPQQTIEPDSDDDEDDDDTADDDVDEEPKLKYSRLTRDLGPIYRNGDATATFMVAGDKMIIGTHNGNIPFVPSASDLRSADQANASSRRTDSPAGNTSSPRAPRQAQVPPTPSNQIYIASSSIDGHVCVSSLVDPKDVTLRNFGRPVQAVALSPDYKNDRSYLSGGLAGELIHTVGGPIGVRSNANTSAASQAAHGWLGAIGLGGHGGRDTILHSGEGTITAIKWSLSGKFLAWANEHGVRLMRTDLHLDSADSDDAWKRIGIIEKPNRRVWQDMASVWKPRIEWIDDQSLESDDDAIMRWGDTAWIVHVRPGGAGVGRNVGERSVGTADVIRCIHFDDCIVSGISLYTPSLLLVLAYRTRDDDDNPVSGPDTTPRGGRQRRTNGLSPELKLIDAATSDEVEVDSLTVSRYESLSAADYHLGTLYVPHPKTMTPAQRSALEAIGGGIWDVGASAARIFSSGASVMNLQIGSDKPPSRAPSMSSASVGNISGSTPTKRQQPVHPNAASAGLKVFIQSPYDCVLAVKRELSDHFQWELEHENYKDAWELLEDHPEIISSIVQIPSDASDTGTPVNKQGSLHEFFADDDSQTTLSATRANQNSAVEKEKRKIGDLWVQQLVSAGDWKQAGKVAGRVLGTSARWEHWVWKFAQTNHFNEISPYVPKKPIQPPLPSMVYEVILGHYIIHDRVRFKHLLEDWDPDLFDINSVIEAIKSKLSAGDVTEESIEGDVQGRDWRILQDGLAKLFLASGRQREALRCYIRLQNSEAAMTLIRDFHLVEAVRDDIPGFIMMGVSKELMKSASTKLEELEEASAEAINVLVEEGCRGSIPASDVESQLQAKGPSFRPFLHFYLRKLWKPEMHERTAKTAKERVAEDRLVADGKLVAEEFADLMVELFAEYDRPLLMEYLRKSQSYDLSKATAECERREYIPELVHILSKTGQTKRALYLIIEKLSDVSFAISFAKEQDDPDLWNDLLEYSMDKPHFIRGLLEEVGTAIDPIKLVRRIPEGLEIEGLRDGIGRMVREYEIQYSISEGVARVLRGEVAAGMDTLRSGQKRGVKFEVIPCDGGFSGKQARHHHVKGQIDIETKGMDPATAAKLTAKADKSTKAVNTANAPAIDPTPPGPPEGDAPPGHCVGCHCPFTLPTVEEESAITDGTTPLPPSRDTLVGFACGHVFHLACLLPKTNASASVAAGLQQQLANDAQESGGRWTRSVGAKVAHAHVIKKAVGRGCVVCREREVVGTE